MSAPAAFEIVVATVQTIDPADADTRPHWGITFAVEDADAAASTAQRLGGRVLSEPMDVPWVRTTTIQDPQGAVFGAGQFKPENQDTATG